MSKTPLDDDEGLDRYYWAGVLPKRVLRAHWSWYERGKEGEGRIVREGKRLRYARIRDLAGARFVRCDFSDALFGLGNLREIELIDCAFDRATLHSARMTKGVIHGGTFVDAGMQLLHLEETDIDRGDWSRSDMRRSDWSGARVQRLVLGNVDARDATMDGATFTDCDFRDARLGASDMPHLCTARGTRFERCDFRGADFDGRKLDGTVFDHCRFHGIKGKPVIEGPYTVIAPDFSADGDGSDIREPAEIARLWGPPSPGDDRIPQT